MPVPTGPPGRGSPPGTWIWPASSVHAASPRTWSRPTASPTRSSSAAASRKPGAPPSSPPRQRAAPVPRGRRTTVAFLASPGPSHHGPGAARERGRTRDPLIGAGYAESRNGRPADCSGERAALPGPTGAQENPSLDPLDGTARRFASSPSTPSNPRTRALPPPPTTEVPIATANCALYRERSTAVLPELPVAPFFASGRRSQSSVWNGPDTTRLGRPDLGLSGLGAGAIH